LNISRYFTGPRGKAASVHFYLAGTVAIILIPALLFGGWLTVRSTDSERSLLESGSENKASQVMADIDDDIAAAKATLIALAGSHFLQVGDFAGLYRQCVDVAAQFGAQFVLRDAVDGHQIINSALVWGEALPSDTPPEVMEAMKSAIQSGGPTVSNVFFSEALQKFIVNVGIPVKRDGAALYFLSIGIPVHTFADSLQGGALPAHWIVSLVDGTGTIIARSDRNELAGSKVKNSDLAKRVAQDGFAVGNGRDGITYRVVMHRSQSTDWSVFVSIPLSELEAPARSALKTYAAASGALFVLAIALSLFFAERAAQLFGEMGIDRTPTRQEFRILFESAPNGVLVVDDGGLIVLANDKIGRQFGYSRDELIGRPVEILIPERFRREYSDLRYGFSAAPESQTMGVGRELYGRRKDGSDFRIEIGLNSILTGNGDFVMATVVDVTLRVLSEQKLAAALAERDDLRRRFMQAQEGERLRLAHELHDQIGQTLTAAMLELKDLESQLKDDGLDRARTLRRSMEQMGKTLHRVAWELRPASIDELGLTSALADYVSEWSRQYAIEADFLCRDPSLDSIAEEKCTAIYRIVQEALTNVAKHAAGASAVSVVIDRADTTLQLTIEDNGQGIDGNATAQKRRGGGLGLAGVRERLTLIGGEMELESSTGAGTTIFARIPLDTKRLIA
jgi:PAS domain S-box-containing protein